MLVWILFILTFCGLIVAWGELDKSKSAYKHAQWCHQKELDQMAAKLEETKAGSLNIIKVVVTQLIKQVQQKGIYTNYKAKTLCDVIMRNLEELGVAFVDEYGELIIRIEHLNCDNFEKTIKTALYADKGYLTIHTPEDKPMYRVGKDGKHIPIQTEEYFKMINKEYDFIFDSIELR